MLYYNFDSFKRDIVEGNCCFICGSSPKSKEFNDEHVIPDWILKRYKLRDKEIFLPNNRYFKYSNYKIPCCKECNSDLGKRYEIPMSKLFNKGYSAVSEYLNTTEGKEHITRWLALIFLKTHLKDMKLNFYRNRNLTEKIGDRYDWEKFRNLHALIRSHHTGIIVDPEIYGTLKIFPSVFPAHEYCDSRLGTGSTIKLGEISLLCIFDDCGIIGQVIEKELLEVVKPRLNPFQLNSLQLSEIFIFALCMNEHLFEKPVFFFDYRNPNELSLTVRKPNVIRFKPQDISLYKEICRRVFSEHMRTNDLQPEVYKKILDQKFSFFDEEIIKKQSY